jgi:uncharacterized protein (TIGR03435 family)
MKSTDKTFEQELERLMGHTRCLSSSEVEPRIHDVRERLHSESSIEASQMAFESIAVRPTWRLPKVGVLMALATVAVVIGISILFLKALLVPDYVYAIVEAAEGGIYRVTDGVTRSVSVGERIDTETPLRTGADATAVLKISVGGSIEMQEKSEISLERAHDGVRIRLNGGSVRVTPAKQSRRNLYLQSKEVTVPIVGAVFQSTVPVLPQNVTELPDRFEVVSVRPSSPFPQGTRGGGNGVRAGSPCLNKTQLEMNPGRLIARRTTLHALLAVAYGVSCTLTSSISGEPDWAWVDAYDVEATIPAGSPVYSSRLLLEGNAPKLQKMFQNLLADRFKLIVKRESKEMPGYDLIVARAAHWECEAPPTCRGIRLSENQDPKGNSDMGPGPIVATTFNAHTLISEWASGVASLNTGRPVIDRTGLQGYYDIRLEYPDVGPSTEAARNRRSALPAAKRLTPERSRGFVSAIGEQLGFKLEPTTVVTDVVVIEHVEAPSEN